MLSENISEEPKSNDTWWHTQGTLDTGNPQKETELTGTPVNFCLYVIEHSKQITTGKGIV